jgi:hypothetical protein
MSDAQNRFLDLLKQVCLRPGLYTGSRSYAALAHWIGGLDMGWRIGEGESPLRLGDFSNWLSLRSMIYGPAWNWSKLILHEAGSEERAMELLPILYESFFQDASAQTSDGLYEGLQAALIERFGVPHHQPETRVTEELAIAQK